jgi:hypothetical protein
MIKTRRNAVELAKLVRSQLAQPKLRIGVFPKGNGWYARVYGDEASARPLQKQIDDVTKALNEIYDLEN